jgi:hypothetical protein
MASLLLLSRLRITLFEMLPIFDQNVGMRIVILFVGAKLFKTVTHVIVRNVARVGIGVSGIVMFATGVPMVFLLPVKAAGIANGDFCKII